MPKVMIIDDDTNSTMLLKTLLEMDGYEVSVVLRSADALKKAQSFRPDVFLVDYHLDDRSGVDVLQELRATPKFSQTPVIMASGRDISDEAKEAGANMFLIKPYDPEKLSGYFDTLLDN